jgi:hypothetical protein
MKRYYLKKGSEKVLDEPIPRLSMTQQSYQLLDRNDPHVRVCASGCHNHIMLITAILVQCRRLDILKEEN